MRGGAGRSDNGKMMEERWNGRVEATRLRWRIVIRQMKGLKADHVRTESTENVHVSMIM
jgi:hypothetical protein